MGSEVMARSLPAHGCFIFPGRAGSRRASLCLCRIKRLGRRQGCPMGTALRIRLQFKSSFLMIEFYPAPLEHVNSFTGGMSYREHASRCRNPALKDEPGREGPSLAVGGARSG